MLYTGKGDGGTTKTLATPERIPKNHIIIEALGALDELNCWIGYCRSSIQNNSAFAAEHIGPALFSVQENLFIIQGLAAGAQLDFPADKLTTLEKLINHLETKLPLIKSFLIPGETVHGAIFDIARTVARRTERAVVAARSELKLSDEAFAYLNRLSSLLYALARFASASSNTAENAPSYT